MQKRDALYKDFVKEKNAQFKNRLGTLYRSYRNQVVSLIRKNKKKYYAEYFEQHQANIKKTWDGIRELINVNKKTKIMINKIIHNEKVFTDKKGIAETMNNFFVNIGDSIEKKIPKAKKSFQSYLQDPNPNRLVLNQCDAVEIASIIASFGAGKATGPFSIPTNLLKEFSRYFVDPLVTIFNKTLQEGIFPLF